MTKCRPFCMLITFLAGLAACKPPPTDADLQRDMPTSESQFASVPLMAPDTQNSLWSRSLEVEGRLIYGNPGEPALLSLQCVEEDGSLPRLRITRLAPADEGAGALLALVGNGHIGRIAVDARKMGSRFVWQGEAPASDVAWEPLTGPRHLAATVPGAGRLDLNPSPLPGEMIGACRSKQIGPVQG